MIPVRRVSKMLDVYGVIIHKNVLTTQSTMYCRRLLIVLSQLHDGEFVGVGCCVLL